MTVKYISAGIDTGYGWESDITWEGVTRWEDDYVDEQPIADALDGKSVRATAKQKTIESLMQLPEYKDDERYQTLFASMLEYAKACDDGGVLWGIDS